MRFFIGCSDVCGMINIYAEELKRLGHTTTTCTYVKNKFHPNEKFDIVANNWADYLLDRPLPSFINKAAVTLKNRTSLFDKHIEHHIYDQHDVFIFIWAGIYLQHHKRDLQLIKQKGKKIISILVGSDVRYPYAFQQEFGMDVSKWPANYHRPYAYFNKTLRDVEMYSDIILSVPDQMGLAIRDYDHFQIPVDLKKYQYNLTGNDKPVVIHAPSNPAIKATDIILNTLEKLKDEGLSFDLKFIQNMENSELLKLLSQSDILVDEMIVHGPALLSFEAMASGCAVATKYLQSSPDCFRPPVKHISPENIYQTVKELIINKDLRQNMAIQGRAYLEKNNTAEALISKMLEKLNNPDRKKEYRPTFFRDHFTLPATENKLSEQDKLASRLVAEKWMPDYEQYKQSLLHRDLI